MVDNVDDEESLEIVKVNYLSYVDFGDLSIEDY